MCSRTVRLTLLSLLSAATAVQAFGTSQVCLNISKVLDATALDYCKGPMMSWYTDVPTGDTQLQTIKHPPDQEPESVQQRHCRQLVKTVTCLIHFPFCINKTDSAIYGPTPYHHFRPCRSMCDFLQHCQMPSLLRNTLRESCSDIQRDREFVTEQQFRSGSFFSDVIDEDGNVVDDKRLCVPGYEADIPVTKAPAAAVITSCPTNLKTSHGRSYSFLGLRECAMACDGVLFEQKHRDSIRYWSFFWSVLCFASSVFTFATYLIDKSRFNFPELSIIYLSFCYIFISASYIVGFLMDNKLACNSADKLSADAATSDDSPPPSTDLIVTQSVNHLSCTLSFTVLYYFTMASSLWWVVLCFTWYLMAGLKWSHEAIASKALFFHMVVWLVPLALSVSILVLNGVEGDPVSGTCFTGIVDANMLRYFVFLPLLLFLLIGFTVIVLCFVSMCQIRSMYRESHDAQSADRLAKLMVRIGVFSLFYMLPTAVVVGCYFYEQSQRTAWHRRWYCDNYPCPQHSPSAAGGGAKPDFWVFLVKYFMNVIVGITSSFWIWSSKTLHSWTSVLCCCLSLNNSNKKTTTIAMTATSQKGAPNKKLNNEMFMHNPLIGRASGCGGAQPSPAVGYVAVPVAACDKHRVKLMNGGSNSSGGSKV